MSKELEQASNDYWSNVDSHLYSRDEAPERPTGDDAEAIIGALMVIATELRRLNVFLERRAANE